MRALAAARASAEPQTDLPPGPLRALAGWLLTHVHADAADVPDAPETSAWLDEVETAGAAWSPPTLKVGGAQLTHRTEHGAVAHGLHGPDELHDHARAFVARFSAAGLKPTTLMLHPQVSGDVELSIGAQRYPPGGSPRHGWSRWLMGRGARRRRVARDVRHARRPRPRAERVARPPLDGVRGRAPVDREALLDLLARVQRQLLAHPEVIVLALTSILLDSDQPGALILDARLRVDPVSAA